MNVVILESKQLTALIGRHRKALHTLNFLLHNIKEPNPHGMLFSTAEVIETLGLSRDELREGRKLGELKFSIVDKQIFYRLSDIIDYKCRLEQEELRKIIKKVSYSVDDLNKL
ncbi:MAG: hypothetical protein R3Y68_08780 [Rikenellaceae bacterium]